MRRTQIAGRKEGTMRRRVSTLALIGLLIGFLPASAQQQLVSIGDRRISIDCQGTVGARATVILMAGGGRTAKDWEQVQPTLAREARVCSYDRAGLGTSDKTDRLQSAVAIVEDLRALLTAAGERGPFILVAHSIAGIHARGFESRFPRDTAALVFVDSSHEEQALRLRQLAPELPWLPEPTALQGFFVEPGQRLEWRTEVPLIALRHGKAPPKPPQFTEAVYEAYDRAWTAFQEDLAKRSPRGELRVAEQSGHMIQIDQPELVVQAIRDVMGAR
jgi:pimeloyl-ACP methyl ester carboxylesterase